MVQQKRIDRFDDVVRSELYFTATLLPIILFHDDFRGLRAFLELVDEKTDVRHDRSGEAEIEVITEFHIVRDLIYARLLPTDLDLVFSDASDDLPTRSAPDMVIIFGNELVACEGKFFSHWKPDALAMQLRAQRDQLLHLLRLRPELQRFRHVALLPVQFNVRIESCDAVITWQEIADLSDRVLGAEHYVTQRLKAAIKHYGIIIGDPDDGELHENEDRPSVYDGILPLEQLLELCQVRGDAISVGHVGGDENMRKRSSDYLINKPWKWRDPVSNRGNADPKNWIPGDQFLEIVQELERETDPLRAFLIEGQSM